MGSQTSARVSSRISRLPSRFPVGTRFVIEGRGGRIHLQYLEFPDGRQIELPADLAKRAGSRNSRRTRAMRQKAAARKF
jgi:hypothetical protein